MRDSGQRKLTYSSQNHCTSTLRSGRRKTIVSQTMCASAERLSQSEIVLPLRKTCYYSPLAEVGVSTQTEINSGYEENSGYFVPDANRRFPGKNIQSSFFRCVIKKIALIYQL